MQTAPKFCELLDFQVNFGTSVIVLQSTQTRQCKRTGLVILVFFIMRVSILVCRLSLHFVHVRVYAMAVT